jgi:hypothetical protein
MNCPGAYPYNFTCDNGLCGKPQCTKDEDCAFGGLLENFKCFTVGGEKSCHETCMADTDCNPGTQMTYSGSGDAGTKFCMDAIAVECMNDALCVGLGKCNLTSKTCECAADDDCTAMGSYQCVP